MRDVNCRHISPGRIRSYLLAILTGMLMLSWQPAPPGTKWSALRKDDNLSGWIYSHIQYVAGSPSARASILSEAARTAWRRPRTDEEAQAWLDLLTNEGYAYLQRGDIVLSTDSYTAAFQWARQHAATIDPAQVLDNILKPLGNNYTRLGDYEQALFIHGKALALAGQLDDNEGLAGTYGNLASTAANMGRPALSLDYCRRGLQVVKNNSAFQGLLLSEQADAWRQLDHPSEARSSLLKSIGILRQHPTAGSGFWLLTAYQQAAEIAITDPQTALSYYRQAFDLFQSLRNGRPGFHRRELAKLQQGLADCYFTLADTAHCHYWLAQTLTTLLPGKSLDNLGRSDIMAENTLADCLLTGAKLAGRQGRTDQALRLYSLCFATDARLRNELITGSSREWSVSVNRDRFEQAISTAFEAWQHTQRPEYRQSMLDFIEAGKAQLLADERNHQAHMESNAGDSITKRTLLLQRALIYYKKELLQHSATDDSLIHDLQSRISDIQWQLAQLDKKHPRLIASVSSVASATSIPPSLHAITRSWFAGNNALYTVETDAGGIRFVAGQDMPKGWQDTLRAFRHHWFETGPRNMLDAPADYCREAYAIFKQITGDHPFEKDRHYIILPDGALDGLPVEALLSSPVAGPSPAAWPYLIKTVSISYAWSLATLIQQCESPGDNKGMSGFFISDNTRHLPQLQAIRQEQTAIAAILPNARWFLDSQASAASFRQALQESAIVHISSHAFSGKDSSTQPRIECSDQPFYLFELKDLLHHPSLVVLDACRTGDGRLVTGEGLQSLARAFSAGGANAVVSGWWNINDQTSARLMASFYHQLITGKESIAESLRQSKLDWLSDPQVPYQQKLPYYWAALEYSGSPTALSKTDLTETNSRKSPWLPASVIVVIAVFAIGLMRRFRRH